MKELKSAILESDLTKLNLILSQNRAAELNSYSEKDKENVLISLIEELSEDIYCSGWNDRIEKELWNWGNGISEHNKIFVRRAIESDVKLALDFGNEIGLWAEWNDEQSEPCSISLSEWKNKLNE